MRTGPAVHSLVQWSTYFQTFALNFLHKLHPTTRNLFFRRVFARSTKFENIQTNSQTNTQNNQSYSVKLIYVSCPWRHEWYACDGCRVEKEIKDWKPGSLKKYGKVFKKIGENRWRNNCAVRRQRHPTSLELGRYVMTISLPAPMVPNKSSILISCHWWCNHQSQIARPRNYHCQTRDKQKE